MDDLTEQEEHLKEITNNLYANWEGEVLEIAKLTQRIEYLTNVVEYLAEALREMEAK